MADQSKDRTVERVTTTSDGIRIAYDDRGDGGETLLLLPGWASSRVVFASLMAPLSTSHRVLSMDFRNHGSSGRDAGDYGIAQLVEDALAVLEQSGAATVVPVALSHAGWVAIELRKRLGDRIAGLVLLDWIVLDPPAPFLGALAALQSEESWRGVRDQLFAMWLGGTNNEEVSRFLSADMGSYGSDVWARAGREIANSYRRHRNPLKALAELQPPPPTLHLYAQPDDPQYLAAQQSFAAQHPWFHPARLQASTHFPMFESPLAVSEAITAFIRGGS